MTDQNKAAPSNHAKPMVESFYDKATGSFSHLLYEGSADVKGTKAALIDPVADFDYASGTIAYQQAKAIGDRIEALGLDLAFVLETHLHADHISAAPYFMDRFGCQLGIGSGIRQVMPVLESWFHDQTLEKENILHQAHLFEDGEALSIGGLHGYVMKTPGHTPACATYVFGDAAFIGDTMFMPDCGTARTDFPGGEASELYDSLQRLLSLPPETRLFLCHDYPPAGRAEPSPEISVQTQKAKNIHCKTPTSKDDFIERRQKRDKELSMPRLIFPALQINARGGHLPSVEVPAQAFVKVPVQMSQA